MNAPEPGVFRKTYTLAYPDADAAGYVRLTSVLNLLQIHAGDHTQSLGFDYREHRENGVYWVLSRLVVRFDAWPEWPCDFTLDTWTRSTKALFALRDFRFGAEGEGWCGRASSAWVVLKDRKPQRPEPWVRIYSQISPEEPLSALPAALPGFRLDPEAESRAEPLFRQAQGVRASWDDLDMNGHVNNVNAVGWCLAQHDFAFLTRWRPAHLEVNFLAEMFCDQKFQILRDELPAPEGSRCFDYVVVRDEDQVQTLRLRVSFK
jgi:acyl-ACP thioesterase